MFLFIIWSCIVYFESGGINVDFYVIGSYIFVMCYLILIFVVKSLLSDLMFCMFGEKDKYIFINYIERIFGNVGKFGLMFLVMLWILKFLVLDYSLWYKVVYELFDG